MSQWYDDETFWTGLYPFLFPDEKFDIADEEVSGVLGLAGLDEGDVLDLACGPGRHAVALAKRGLHVTGVDLSPFLLERAKGLACSEGVDVEWVREDMRRFVRPEAFGLVINMFTAFGYFEDKRDDLTVLRNVHRSLRDGGALIIDTKGKEWLARGFLATVSQELDEGKLLVQRHEICDDWTRVKNHWVLIEDGKAESFRFETTVYSGQELKDRLLEAGFEDVSLFGGLDGSEYGLDARRLVVVARK